MGAALHCGHLPALGSGCQQKGKKNWEHRHAPCCSGRCYKTATHQDDAGLDQSRSRCQLKKQRRHDSPDDGGGKGTRRLGEYIVGIQGGCRPRKRSRQKGLGLGPKKQPRPYCGTTEKRRAAVTKPTVFLTDSSHCFHPQQGSWWSPP